MEPDLDPTAAMPESETTDVDSHPTLGDGIGVGDRVILLFSDDQKRMSVRLSVDKNDLENGRLSMDSPLGKAILGAEEGDEVEFHLDDGRVRKVLTKASKESRKRSFGFSAYDSNGFRCGTDY